MSGFTEIAIIISLAAIFGVFARKLKQPEILGYIVAGIVVGILFPAIKNNPDHIKVFSEIGVAFLLFIVGLELNLSEIKKFGKSIIFVSLFQVIFTWGLAFLLSLVLRFDFVTSVYIGICLTFSSTIVVIKILSQKNELDTLHGKLSVVFLVVQDFAAIASMILLTTFKNLKGDQLASDLLLVLVKGLFLFGIIMIVTKFVLPFLFKFINKERETLFLCVIAWALFLSALVGSSFIGFSIEIGALLAGISIADRYEHLQIESWMKPLRDFFLTLFFVLLGLNVSIDSIETIIFPAIIFSAFVLFLKPLIVVVLLHFIKFGKRESVFTGISLGQISEFGLLVIGIGVSANIVSSSVLTLITIVGGITMIVSSYMIMYNHIFFEKIKPFLFYKDNKSLLQTAEDLKDHIVLLGCHRVGKNILDYLVKSQEKVLVVDHNPNRVESLKKLGINAIMGDLRDLTFLDNLKIDKARFVISTLPLMDVNKTILNIVDKLKEKPGTLFLAKEDDEIAELYEQGADYVIYPHLLAGQKVNMILKNRNDIHKHKIHTMKTLLSSRIMGK